MQIWGIDTSTIDCGALIYTPGDVDLDTFVNGGDIQAFVDIVLDPGGAWTAEQLCAADMSADGSADFADVDLFVAELLN